MATTPPTPLPWGDDGFVPVLDTNPLWRPWAKKDIWLGQNAQGKFIPKVDDYVEDTEFHITYQVTGHNEIWVPTLKRITPKPIADMDSEDMLLGQTRDAFRCFIDKRVKPFRLQVDGRTYVNARNARAARVFRGNPINGVEEIVSLVLDSSGLPIGTLIPLELGYTPNGQNVAQYYVPTAYTNVDIKDGEFLYVMFYDDTGAVLSSKELRAVETSFTRSTDVSIRAVTDVALEGPLMSKLVPGRLEVPLNLTLNSINLLCAVSYNSGAAQRFNVDGGRAELLGLNAFVPSVAGEHFPMRLKYNLAQGEVSFLGGQVGLNRFITKEIDVLVVDVENQLTVKLYPYPVWVSALQGYRLRWFMLNLDRNIMYDVTPLVQIGEDSPSFDPLLYGVKQQLTVAVDLSQVNGNWRAWRYVQTVGITLLKAGTEAGTKWRLAFDPLQTPEYGTNLELQSRFVNQNLSEIDLKSGFTTMADWVKAFYTNTRPLLNPQLETDAPTPTHFILTDGNGVNQVKLSIEDNWNHRFSTNFPVLANQTWYLKFVKQGPSEDLILSVAGVSVKQVTAWP